MSWEEAPCVGWVPGLLEEGRMSQQGTTPGRCEVGSSQKDMRDAEKLNMPYTCDGQDCPSKCIDLKSIHLAFWTTRDGQGPCTEHVCYACWVMEQGNPTEFAFISAQKDTTRGSIGGMVHICGMVQLDLQEAWEAKAW